MSKKQGAASQLPARLPDDFFDSNKKSKKEQEDELAREMEQFEKEMAALQEESDEQLREEFEKLQGERNLDELDQQIDQWKRVAELEKKAEQLKNKPSSGNPSKKLRSDTALAIPKIHSVANNEDSDVDSNEVEDYENKLSDWRSRRLR